MKVCVFILLIIVGVLVLPDACFYTFVKRFIPINGNGEFNINILPLIKTLACALVAGVVITLFVLAEYP